MQPSTDREHEIARRVDARANENNLPISAVAEISEAFPCRITESEGEFLIHYIIWRREHPIGQEIQA